jgi:hypothetical protein
VQVAADGLGRGMVQACKMPVAARGSGRVRPRKFATPMSTWPTFESREMSVATVPGRTATEEMGTCVCRPPPPARARLPPPSRFVSASNLRAHSAAIMALSNLVSA